MIRDIEYSQHSPLIAVEVFGVKLFPTWNDLPHDP